ncbi:Adaptive-response sensory-kinase SasA [Planktothrix tepida]|uniref:Adaptive-response sensory-kinase SasA n=3 Tax=Microcoleaceae TaxID=1892252 RepID=A0A1J1LV89_9CYAN|nr:Adaptive-response sensory-kinase SasA [Planktothrix pseudagardhii]CAD5979145.1 Adaptive-response sensory-kinase SasA [Planktothrix tepida]CUR36174.1 Adaptive-response sensory-kinase SasA [Planktothrix tepida PCC 9214]
MYHPSSFTDSDNSLPLLLQTYFMQAFPEKQSPSPEVSLQLLLFVDQRPSSQEHIRQVRQFLEELNVQDEFELQIIDVGEQPYLAEHFKLIATPTLIKIHPEPRQVLAGSNLVTQLEHWWPRWQQTTELLESDEQLSSPVAPAYPLTNSVNSVVYAGELMKLSDETFRLKQEKELLQQQLQFKDRIIEILAHDLRSPLTAASLALETLSSDQITVALKVRLIQQARSQIHIIDRMITDILQTASSPNIRLQIQPNQLDLTVFLNQILTELDSQFQSKSLNLKTDIPHDTPCVYADQERIRQVVVNLLDNAIKYTPRGGSLQVSVLHRTSQKVQVSICDSGPGIPEENRDRIFQEHFRLARDEAQEGYGIGLSLCKRIIVAHYGNIWVDSSFTKGSCFHFTLPVYH